MKRSIVSTPASADGCPCNGIVIPQQPARLALQPVIHLDGIGRNLITYIQNPNMKMSPPLRRVGAFSLVEVTLALGVAAFCLIAILGMLPVALKTQQASVQHTIANGIISTIHADLRADLILPPGQYTHLEEDHGYQLHGHWAGMMQPDTLYFTQEGKQTGTVNGSAPADAIFRAKITYNPIPPTGNTSVANIVVSWPAQVDPDQGGVPAGSTTTLIAVNR